MKQRKVVSLIGALVLIISAVVLITGCSQPNSNKGNTGNNSGNISNNGGNTGNNGGNTGNNGGNTGNNGGNTGNNGGNTGNNGGNTGNNGGNTGNNGGSTGNNGGNTGSTDILKKDIIEFETASVKCTNTNSYTKVTSGSQIQEKDKLLFEAILPTGKVVENWYINDAKQKYQTDSVMVYTVKAADIVGNKLKVSVITKDAVQGTVEFDVASVKCQKTNSFLYTDVTSGSQIQEKDELYFKAILPTGKVVENWYINDVKQKYNTDSVMGYKVKASDIASGTLKISVVFK